MRRQAQMLDAMSFDKILANDMLILRSGRPPRMPSSGSTARPDGSRGDIGPNQGHRWLLCRSNQPVYQTDAPGRRGCGRPNASEYSLNSDPLAKHGGPVTW